MKKTVFALIGLSMIISFALAQMQSSSFKGSTPYQSGMTLEEASELAAVSEEEAIAVAQSLVSSIAEEISAEITVVDGFIVWAVDLGMQVAYIDINNPEISSTQEVMADAYDGGESDYEEDDDHEEYEDDDHEEYEEKDAEEYEDDDDHEEDDD